MEKHRHEYEDMPLRVGAWWKVVYAAIRVIAEALFWLAIASSLLVVLAAMGATGAIGNVMGFISFTGGMDMGFHFADALSTQLPFGSVWVVLLLVMFVATAIPLTFLLRGFLRSARRSSPLTLRNAQRLISIGLLLLFKGYVTDFASYFAAQQSVHEYARQGIAPVLVPQLKLLPETAFIGLCVLMCAAVFRYGCVLLLAGEKREKY